MTREECMIFLRQVKHVLLRSKSWLDSTHKPIQQAFDMAIEALKEQKTGEWVVYEQDYVPQCSECGYVPAYNKYLNKYYYSNWCPNCGARMEIEHDNRPKIIP